MVAGRKCSPDDWCSKSHAPALSSSEWVKGGITECGGVIHRFLVATASNQSASSIDLIWGGKRGERYRRDRRVANACPGWDGPCAQSWGSLRHLLTTAHTLVQPCMASMCFALHH